MIYFAADGREYIQCDTFEQAVCLSLLGHHVPGLNRCAHCGWPYEISTAFGPYPGWLTGAALLARELSTARMKCKRCGALVREYREGW